MHPTALNFQEKNIQRLKKPSKAWFQAILVLVGLYVFGLLAKSGVDNTVTDEDKKIFASHFPDIPQLSRPPEKFSAQINQIQSIQTSVLKAAPGNQEIPEYHTREPKDLLSSRSGLCYDRSRSIEKLLRYAGFQTRHISMYFIVPKKTAFNSLLTRGSPSHALTEVLTEKGWLIVNSDSSWVSLDRRGEPVSMKSLHQASMEKVKIDWGLNQPGANYQKPFIFIYGLYSRHGKFYPPFNAIPDVNYGELMDNLF